MTKECTIVAPLSSHVFRFNLVVFCFNPSEQPGSKFNQQGRANFAVDAAGTWNGGQTAHVGRSER